MPFYQQANAKQLGVVFREGLDDLRSAMFKLAYVKGSSTQMTDAQFGEEFGFTDDTAAKAEMESGVGHLLNGDSGVNGAQIKAAVDQMLNQFG